MASAAGRVRVRPTGLAASPARNRYQYQRSGFSPSASAWTVCPSCGVATAVPRATTFFIASSSATSHATGTGSGFIPPSGSSGFGASLVHSTTLVASGSPDATPSVNGSAAKVTLRSAAHALSARSGRAARAAP